MDDIGQTSCGKRPDLVPFPAARSQQNLDSIQQKQPSSRNVKTLPMAGPAAKGLSCDVGKPVDHTNKEHEMAPCSYSVAYYSASYSVLLLHRLTP